MDLTNFSLLFPDEKSKQEFYSGNSRANIDMYTLQQLGMPEILDLSGSDLSEYCPTSPEVIK